MHGDVVSPGDSLSFVFMPVDFVIFICLGAIEMVYTGRHRLGPVPPE